MSKTKVICFANNKGGSGKSTACCNVGYSMVTDEAGTLVTSADTVEPGQRIHVSLRSGSLTAQVTQIQEEDRHA